MRHRFECPLRWADMDQLRHVNNVTYADYLQEARIDFFRALALGIGVHGDDPTQPPAATGSSEDAFGIIVVRHEITYLAPLRFDFAPVSVETWVGEVRAASFSLGYEVFHEDADGVRTVYLRAATRLAPFVFGSSRPRRLTPPERAALAPYLENTHETDAVGAPAAATRLAAAADDPARRHPAGHYPVHVRFSDLDPYGHVNNVTYLEYLQEGRVLFHGRLWRDLPADVPHTGLVVAQTDCDYLRPMVGRPGGYDLWTWVESVGGRSVVLGAEITEPSTEPGTGAVMARARVVAVFFDSAAGRSVEPPAAYRDPLVAAMAGATPG